MPWFRLRERIFSTDKIGFERANDSARVEFWNLYTGELTVAAAGAALTEYQHFYNHLRPHRTLDMRTPMEYLATWKATLSHMY